MHGQTQRVAVVTGSSSGIGQAIAERLDLSGYSVLVHGRLDEARGRAVADRLNDATYIDADLAVPAGAAALLREVQERWGRLDLLVNNAGIGVPHPHRDISGVSAEFWNRVISANLSGPWFVSQAFQPLLTLSEGSIINVASIAGLTVSGSSVPYAVSKAGLIHLTKLLAVAMGPEVRVNAVAPGYIETLRTADWSDVREHVELASPLRKSGRPDDVADACMSVLSSGYITGAILTVDGGLSLV